MIVATAGHVDHGKTSLVKALTGVDTDHLAEEKRRGLSIDLGFAYADLGTGERIGFVDVPGHERFLRNMLAGVAGIDLALLVIAADDGPMPQTLEHLGILRLLGVAQCVVALTKIDRVSPERVRQAEQEIAALLHDGPFAGAPVFTIASPAGIGVPALRGHLREAAQAAATRGRGGRFRLAVDRSFTLPGAGRIVTGVVLSGTVAAGDPVIVSPAGVPARVRSLHAQHENAVQARAGQRCALNLAGLDLKHAEPVRGDWVLAPQAHAPTLRLDVQLELLATEPRPLTERAALQLHLGAATRNVRVAPLEGHALAPGQTGMAQLLLDAPVHAVRGDRFILREAAAHRTMAGGQVLDPFGAARGRARPARLAQLAALALPTAAQALAALLEAEPAGVDLARFAQTWNLDDAQGEALHGAVPMVRVMLARGPHAFSPAHWQAWREATCAALAVWHAQAPASIGLTPAALATQLARPGAKAVLAAVLDALRAEGAVVRDGLRLRLSTHRAVLDEADAALLARVIDVLQPAGLRPPIVGELASQLGLPLPALLAFLARASELGQLLRVAPNRYFLPQTVDELVAIARALAHESGSGSFDAASFRDRSGIGRNLTVQVLEFMDREGLMHFDGTRRTPLP